MDTWRTFLFTGRNVFFTDGRRTGMEIGLVSCTKAKADSASTPRELYEPSALFRKARSHVEEHHDEWYVLSTKHHVLDPDGSPIEPYDETLNSDRGITNGGDAGVVQ